MKKGPEGYAFWMNVIMNIILGLLITLAINIAISLQVGMNVITAESVVTTVLLLVQLPILCLGL